MDQQPLIERIRTRAPKLLGIYAFGSRVQGNADVRSDLDLAVLVEGYVEPLELWALAGELEELARCTVDLLDLRRASTVMQHKVIALGERWWAADERAGLFECAMLSEKTALDAARAPLLKVIAQEGRVHAR